MPNFFLEDRSAVLVASRRQVQQHKASSTRRLPDSSRSVELVFLQMTAMETIHAAKVTLYSVCALEKELQMAGTPRVRLARHHVMYLLQ